MVIGAKGLLGTPLSRLFRRLPALELDAADLPELDITDADQVDARMAAFKADLVVNCAAYTAVDACEANEEAARRVNALGAGNVAASAARHAARLIHISTDYVFEGDAVVPYCEDHPPGRPECLTAYGRTKLLGEQAVLRQHPRATLVRTAWLFGPDGPGFPNAILRRVREDDGLRVINDQTGSPTYAPDLASAIVRLAGLDVSGTFHITNSGRCTWYEFACEIVRLAGIYASVTPVTSVEFPRPARRPAFSVLDNRRYVELAGAPLRSWQEAIAEFIQQTIPLAPDRE